MYVLSHLQTATTLPEPVLLLQEKNFAAAFAHFDRDGSGSLTTDEIREALASLGVTDDEVHVSPHAVCNM